MIEDPSVNAANGHLKETQIEFIFKKDLENKKLDPATIIINNKTIYQYFIDKRKSLENSPKKAMLDYTMNHVEKAVVAYLERELGYTEDDAKKLFQSPAPAQTPPNLNNGNGTTPPGNISGGTKSHSGTNTNSSSRSGQTNSSNTSGSGGGASDPASGPDNTDVENKMPNKFYNLISNAYFEYIKSTKEQRDNLISTIKNEIENPHLLPHIDKAREIIDKNINNYIHKTGNITKGARIGSILLGSIIAFAGLMLIASEHKSVQDAILKSKALSTIFSGITSCTKYISSNRAVAGLLFAITGLGTIIASELVINSLKNNEVKKLQTNFAKDFVEKANSSVPVVG